MQSRDAWLHQISELVLLDVETKVAHQIRPHLEHGGLGRIKSKVNKNIAAGLGHFLFHDPRGDCLPYFLLPHRC